MPHRASVRAGGTGGLPPVDLEQRVAATRPDLQPLITMRQKIDLEEVVDGFISMNERSRVQKDTYYYY